MLRMLKLVSPYVVSQELMHLLDIQSACCDRPLNRFHNFGCRTTTPQAEAQGRQRVNKGSFIAARNPFSIPFLIISPILWNLYIEMTLRSGTILGSPSKESYELKYILVAKRYNIYSLFSSVANLMARASFDEGALMTRATLVGNALIDPAIRAYNSSFVGSLEIESTPFLS